LTKIHQLKVAKNPWNCRNRG